MKKTATNEFREGLNLDLNPIVTPNSVLTDNLNGTFITYNGNEFCLQNDRGNIFKTELTSGFVPIGIKEHNGVLYIVSVNEFVTEIGTFPGIEDWNIKEGVLDPNYHPLHNLSIESEVYVIYSAWDNDELNEEDITIDNNACIEVINRYNGIYSEGYFGSLFTDKGHNYVYFNSEEDRNNCYIELSALYDIFRQGTEIIDIESLFNAPLNYDLEHPVTIEIQDSYDGSVNLILIDDKNKPRIINSGFSVEPENKYKIIDRNQTVKTNWYDDLTQTELIRTSNIITNFELNGVRSGGQLKGGNYTFYLKFGDADYNQTDVVAESGIVSIFKGNDGVPRTISGTLLDERTDKMISLKITGLNLSYSKLYIYYTREYSDTQGYRMTESGMFTEPIDIRDNRTEEEKDPESNNFCEPYQNIWLSGFEQTQPINIEELNVDYHTIDFARAEAQHSNMLFLGNVGQKETFDLYETLKEYSLNNITAKITYGDSIDKVEYDYNANGDLNTRAEYYNTQNIYYRLGYWPDEYYRFGIVYILEDGSNTPVFNIKGGEFTYDSENDNYVCDNTNYYGVFKTPNVDILSQSELKPLCFNFEFNETLSDSKVVGYFIVRQKRIPLTICQGLSIGIDKKSKTPLTWDGNNWITESFLSYDRSDGMMSEQQWPELIYNELTLGNIDYSNNESAYFHIFLEVAKQTCDVSGNYIYDNSVVNTNSEVENYLNAWLSTWLQQNNLTYNDIIEINGNWDTTRYDGISNYSGTYTIYENLGTITQDEPNSGQYIVVFTDNQIYHWDYHYQNRRVRIVSSVDRASENWWTNLIDQTNSQSDWNTHTIETSEIYKFIQQSDSSLNGSGLLSLDPCVNTSIGSNLDGSKFEVRREYTCNTSRDGLFITNDINSFESEESVLNRCIYVSPRTNIKTVDEYSFSTVVGDGTSTAISLQSIKSTDIEYLVRNSGTNTDNGMVNYGGGVEHTYEVGKNQEKTYMNINLIRGYFAPFVGLGRTFTNDDIGIYSIRNEDTEFAINIREQDNSPFYCVSNRFKLSDDTVVVYGGDCFTNTITFRMQTNFVDPTAPVANVIVDPRSWFKYVILPAILTNPTWDYPVDPTQINLSDVNTVSLGYWVTFKCLSSYNLGLRSVDSFHTDEMALLGSPRSFYPLNGASTATGNKMEESFLLSDGYSATVGEKRYNLLPDTPYSKSEFENRIMFSNVHIIDAFTNGYRTFQGLSYKDYDKQYGAITKLVAYGQNLFIVMEHGLGLVSVNPKALIQTTTGEAIHIYGHGVLPDEMTIISQDYGSKYEHSVVRTPIGIYGIDVDAKKIWRFSDKQGFETFSDMKIETLLKDCLEPFDIDMSISDVRTHYNAFKGDLMFTWYITKQLEGETIKYLWNICYNERQNVWVTRYGWVPIISENINDSFYSLQYDETNYDNIVRIWSHTPDSKLELPDPTNWYNRQHQFEFEFVVSDPIGVNKIFDNLQIISNNTQPNEMEISIVGDVYNFKRPIITPESVEMIRNEYNNVSNTTSDIHGDQRLDPREENNTIQREGVFKWDWRTNQSLLTKWQPFKDIYKFGRRIGNIQYKEGVWYSNIEPIWRNNKEIRIMDKWARIRIRYYGENLAVITAIRTLINI